MLPTRRFYSQGFNIASYVARIEEIAKKQQKPKAAGAQGARSGPKGPRGPRDGTKTGAKGANTGANKAGPRTGPRTGSNTGNTAKPVTATDGQPAPRKQWVKRPEGMAAQTKVQAKDGAKPQQAFRKDRPQEFQRRPETKSLKDAAKPLIPLSGASQAFIYAEAKTRRPAPRSKPAKHRSSKKGPAKRIAAVSRVNVNTSKSGESVPLIFSAKEGLEAVMQNANTTFINVDSLAPRSIASSLVQGPSFNARFWSVVNQTQNSSNVQSAVQSQINGDFSPLLIRDDKVNQSVARTLNANASLSHDQKQFLAKVSAGGMAPSQVKQVRI